MWIVDFNRQSLDRVVPGRPDRAVARQFAAAGWHVVEVKYGHRLQAAFARPGGERCASGSTRMPNEQYQSLFGLAGADAARAVPGRRPGRRRASSRRRPATTSSAGLVTDLGGHDIAALLDAYRASATR